MNKLNNLADDQRLLVGITRIISKRLGNRELTDAETVLIAKKARSVNLRGYSKADLNDILSIFTDQIIATIKKTEFMTSDSKISTALSSSSSVPTVNIAQIFGISDKYKLQRIFNPEALYERNYIELDTSIANVTQIALPSFDLFRQDATPTVYNWEYMENATQTFGVVNTTAKIKDVVGIRMYPLKFAATRGYIDIFNTYNILISEFSAQSFISHQGRKFHFTVTPTLMRAGLNMYVEYSPYEHNKGYIWFRLPYTTLKSFTITLARGNNIVSLPTSVLSGAVINYPFGGFPTCYTNPGIIWTFSTHNAVTGQTMVISGFTTADPVADATVIAQVNTPAGWPITVLDDTHFSIPVDLTVIPIGNQLTEAVVFLNNKDIRTVIPLEIISLKNLDENTN